MNYNQQKKIGQWLAYVWTQFKQKGGSFPGQHQPASPYFVIHESLAYNLPIGESAALSMSAELDPLLQMACPITPMAEALEGFIPCNTQEPVDELDLEGWVLLNEELQSQLIPEMLQRPFIYN